MATNQVVLFKDAPVPAHVQKFQSEHENIPEKIQIDQLSFRGKVWRQVIGGEENALLNAEEEPVSTVHVVVLNHNKSRSRAYYEGAYEEGKSQPPACWSMDGETPDDSVKEPQSPTCAKCKWSVKGSKITPQGKEVTACSVFKRIAVIPLSNLESKPMLLRLAQTSMWDKNNEENEAKGYYAWDQYLDMLRTRGALHTGVVATKIRFDSRVAYPKLVFAASRWLADEEMEIVAPLFESEGVQKLLNASEIVAAERKTTTPKDEEAVPVVATKKKKAAPEVAAEAEETDEAPPPVAKKKAAAAPPPVDEDEEAPPPPAAKKKAAAAAPPAEDEEEEAPPPTAKKKANAAAEPATAKPTKGKGSGLNDLVNEWDD
jgi:hypothetical protein